MSKKEKKQEQHVDNEITRKSREIWLAGLGALSAIGEEGNKMFKTLVDKGTEYEKKRKEQAEEIWDEVNQKYKKVEKKVDEKFDRAEEGFENSFKSIISTLGIPTRSEVNELSRKVDALIEKIDSLNKEKEEPTTKKEGK